MIRFGIWTVVGLLLALTVHLATVLALPRMAERTAYRRLEELGPDGAFAIVPATGPLAEVLPSPDPAMRVAACRYDLSAGPLHLRAPVPPAFFSVSFYTPDGLNYYALNDRAASAGAIELTLYTSVQLAEVRSREGPDTPEALRIEAPQARGVVILRALAATPGMMPVIEDALSQATCQAS
ncbi:DUF1254 domain-containing protein [Labrys wisconsinensis]|uniref:Membrane protein n=1 Tax=Labrys wisconsinensis TaxID=425677 RepID=A0ABU0J639_9HYPH|nr:DUF1254 domain-containing protein [Labrys wisconsinensis]MDQ0469717.1 putative membrane protein [Labrys wisconsinensis]